jgi:hypothetical protein
MKERNNERQKATRRNKERKIKLKSQNQRNRETENKVTTNERK